MASPNEWQWWVLRHNHGYLGVCTDGKPEGMLCLHIPNRNEMGLLHDYQVVYGPCSEAEAETYLEDMPLIDAQSDVGRGKVIQFQCFTCGQFYAISDGSTDENIEQTYELPICPHCGVGRE